MRRIGVIAGAFDPIHLGHMNFVVRAISEYNLDKVFIFIEKKSRYKKTFASYDDRRKMIELATAQNPKIVIYKTEAINFPISSCLPGIRLDNPNAKLYLLIGKDVAGHIDSWNEASNLLKNVELVVAQREDGITSGKIRDALKNNQEPEGLGSNVHQYIKNKNIY